MLTDDFFLLDDSKGSHTRRNRLAHLPDADPRYALVEKRFKKGWKHPDKLLPPIHAIFKILLTRESLGTYQLYRARVAAMPWVKNNKYRGNEKLLFHGTNRCCLLAEDSGRTRLCELPECHLCRIVGNSFDIGKSVALLIREGHRSEAQISQIWNGNILDVMLINTEADDYVANNAKKSNYRVMLASRVVVGRASKQRLNATDLNEPPAGYHSVIGKPGQHLNYPETVVYSNDAIRPAFLIVYGFPSDKASTSIRSVISTLFKTPLAS
ncbi:hypothetical protein Hypma_014876 [Hypsizygus marmoreus]|uniref:PARP catalytic domain-containing protein n=1 Tax=Hypsizygus marmoreus TaxID=39966 RepID=A0A369K3S5_HYPMA|nr:hypothetical protein Hypma_014876 [Hypsizygus marmoreus]